MTIVYRVHVFRPLKSYKHVSVGPNFYKYFGEIILLTKHWYRRIENELGVSSKESNLKCWGHGINIVEHRERFECRIQRLFSHCRNASIRLSFLSRSATTVPEWSTRLVFPLHESSNQTVLLHIRVNDLYTDCLYFTCLSLLECNYQPALYFHYKIATTKLSYHCRNTTTRLPFNYMKVTTRMFFFCMNLTNKQPFLCINEPARLPCITWMQLPSGLDYMTKSLPFTTWTTIRQHFHNMKFP